MKAFYESDVWLSPYIDKIKSRIEQYKDLKDKISESHKSLKNFASLHQYYGLHKTNTGWVFREFAPNATKIFLIGSFNDWQEREEWELKRIDNGSWEIELAPKALRVGDLYKIKVKWPGGEGERIPTYARRVVQDEQTKIFNAEVDKKLSDKKTTHIDIRSKSVQIYECHIGMATEEYKVGSYEEFRLKILPRIVELGYNTIQIMAIQEHPYYGSFGYHVSNFFAPSSRFGTAQDLKNLIDEAHSLGIGVIMDIVHSHAVKNVLEGIARIDGTLDLYFHEESWRREHPAWDSLCFDYNKEHTLRFLLSNCRYWIEEFGFDGFRFDGVTSMLYTHHGLEKAFTSYEDYFTDTTDNNAIVYLTLANELIHSIHPGAITIAEEMSGMPGLAASVENGGIGFDYRMAMGVPDYWIKIIKEKQDQEWNVSEIFHELTNHRPEEKTINYAESHDQALVGDKTIIFRLIDKEMYWHMQVNDPNLIVERGIALHKMIRLITCATSSGGYLNFMGNEFGHPEWIDFPREGNGWSFHHARRQWSLVDNESLRFRLLNNFDKKMIHLMNDINNVSLYAEHVYGHEGDQVLIFKRNNYLFVFNFSPDKSYSDYGFECETGKYSLILNSDNPEFGGYGRIDENILHYTMQVNLNDIKKTMLKLYIPSRTCMVFEKRASKGVRKNK